MVYTSKLVVFASPNGAEVIDVIPIEEITGVRTLTTGALGPPSRRSSASDLLKDDIFDDDADATNAAKSNRDVTEVTLETKPDGYNSGRAYRVRAATAREGEHLVEDLGRLAAAARERLLRKSWLRSVQVGAPARPCDGLGKRRPSLRGDSDTAARTRA